MPVTPYLRNRAFDPELLAAMSAAFTDACNSLGIAKGRDDAVVELVASHIIEAAQRGMRLRTALYLSAMQKFQPGPSERSSLERTRLGARLEAASKRVH